MMSQFPSFKTIISNFDVKSSNLFNGSSLKNPINMLCSALGGTTYES